MKKILLFLIIMNSFLFGDLKNVNVSKFFLNKNIKIIDIRTKKEWKETGIVKNSYTLEFFDSNGNYNTQKFLKKLNKIVKKEEQFAIICRTGSRTSMVGNYLGYKAGYKVINLKGGIMSLFRQGYKPVRYRK